MAAIHIQSGKKNIQSNSLAAKIQSVPFKIHADCDAKISKYFDTYVKSVAGDVVTASFRGYPLQGKTIDLPKNYKGVILHEGVTPDTDHEERRFYVVHTFDTFTYWNWGKPPSRNDALVQVLDWIDVAEALHSSVVEE